uniref:Uncharacterized protein n=1 Tax=Opuntia streptacantha TaxID=393608 RepID=A0A7C9AZR0_OPUST
MMSFSQLILEPLFLSFSIDLDAQVRRIRWVHGADNLFSISHTSPHCTDILKQASWTSYGLLLHEMIQAVIFLFPTSSRKPSFQLWFNSLFSSALTPWYKQNGETLSKKGKKQESQTEAPES